MEGAQLWQCHTSLPYVGIVGVELVVAYVDDLVLLGERVEKTLVSLG